MNDPKLKLAIAELLPEKIHISPLHPPTFEWKNKVWTTILESEWLYVIHLVEQTLNGQQWNYYLSELENNRDWIPPVWRGLNPSMIVSFALAHAGFNQRATAMLKVKGITV